MILKPPIEKEWLVWRSKDLNAFHLNSLMLQVYTVLFQPLQFRLRIQFLMWMPFRFMLGGIIIHIIDKVMIPSNDNLMLVGKCIKKGNESVEFPSITILGEVASVDEDVCLWKFADVQVLVEVVGVAHC